MGNSSSVNITQNTFVTNLCSKESLSTEEWKTAKDSINQLALSLPLSLMEKKNLDTVFTPLAKDACMSTTLILDNNNLHTSSIGGLMQIVSEWLCSASRDTTKEHSVHISNTLLMLRYLAHEIITSCSDHEDLLGKHFNTIPKNLPDSDKLGDRKVCELLIESIFIFLIDNPIFDANFLIHFECINLLVTLYSTSLYRGSLQKNSRKHNIFLEATMQVKNSFMIRGIIKYFLQNVTSYRENKSTPEWQTGLMRKTFDVIGSLGMTVLYLPISAFSVFFSWNETEMKEFPSIHGKRCNNILLLILFYAKNQGGVNLFLQAVQHLVSKSNEETDLVFAFELLLDCFTKDYDEEMITVLFYAILHESTQFCEYICRLEDPSRVILPLLYKIYSNPKENPHHLYMMVTILTILSCKEEFCHKMNSKMLDEIPWFKERIIFDIPLSSLLMIVLIRLIVHDIAHQKDAFLANSCLAVLLNMAPYFQEIHPHASQKLFYLISVLNKRYHKSINLEEKENYGKFIQISIETLNCILSFAMTKNKWLVYELLHSKEVFDRLRFLPLLEKYINNIDVVSDYFESKVIVSDPNVVLTVDDILTKIIKNFKGWKSEKLILFDHFKFNYSEDSNTELFIYPFVWKNLVSNNKDLLWDMKLVHF